MNLPTPHASSGPASWVARAWNHPAHDFVSLPIRWIVGVTFLIAAWPKLVAPEDFAWSIAMYQMISPRYVHLLAIILPFVELIASVAFLAGFRVRGAAVVMCGMLVMFILALSYAFVHEIEMTSCGCFSPAGAKALSEHRETVGTSLLWRDVWMLIGCGYVWLFDTGRWGVDGCLRHWKKRKTQHG
ncbi:DoxX family membrane protein [Myxococcota bacterium]|nr:DoxX family membrane protein [Myxococcota bacterium]MBU1413069.1 DoxX family membrane protein [Myxococcota bacterium]MBU1510875.1 DoxX family membrane protein [Myxococcota bacterium]